MPSHVYKQSGGHDLRSQHGWGQEGQEQGEGEQQTEKEGRQDIKDRATTASGRQDWLLQSSAFARVRRPLLPLVCEQAMLLLQAGSVEFDPACIARIQPFWETLSAHSRMDLLSIPVAAGKQAAELITLRHGEEGTLCGSVFEPEGACNLLQLRCWTALHMAARCIPWLSPLVLRLCVQSLSMPLSPSAAPVDAQGPATMPSGPPLSVCNHVTAVLPAADYDYAMRLQRKHRIWKLWTGSDAMEFLSAQAYG